MYSDFRPPPHRNRSRNRNWTRIPPFPEQVFPCQAAGQSCSNRPVKTFLASAGLTATARSWEKFRLLGIATLLYPEMASYWLCPPTRKAMASVSFTTTTSCAAQVRASQPEELKFSPYYHPMAEQLPIVD